MQSSGMPCPGDEGRQRWEQAWIAMKKWRILLVGYVGSNLSIPCTPWLSHLSIPRRIFYWKKNLDQVRDHKQATIYTSTWMSKT
ncbi:putative alpha-glucan, water dikinase [Helianthus anomalus]